MKRLLTIVFMAFLMASTPLHADAALELSLDSAEVLPGQTASLNLKLAGGTEKYAGINVTIQVPENITITGVSKGALLNSGFISDYSSDGNRLRIIAYSSSSTFSGTGILFSLSLKADDDASEGEQDITFVTDTSGLLNPNALSNSDGSKSVSPALKNGKITILKDEDIDKDGLPDIWEQQIIDADPNDAITTIEDVKPGDDFDGDEYTNLQEYQYGANPIKIDDVDKDGLPDGWEMKYFGNLNQGPEGNPDGDRYTNLEEYQNHTDPTVQDGGTDPNDVDEDGLPDDWERQYFGNLDQGPNDDPDGDGWDNLEEYKRGTDPNKEEEDVDKDGLPDDWERKYFGNLNQGASGDFDEDGYTNLEEFQNGTDPTKSGDVNGDKALNLKDAIIALKVSCGMSPSPVNTAGDVNGDGQIGIHEAIFVLDQLSRTD